MLTYKKKIFIDRVIGVPLVFLLNSLTRMLGLILRRNHDLSEPPKEIVVAKIVGMGSILHSGVLCRALKKTYPKSHITYITSHDNTTLISRMKYVDAFVTINDNNVIKMIASTCLVVLKLWKIRPDLYFDLELYSSWSSILATLSFAKNRYGFFRKSALFKSGLHTHLLFFNTAQYIGDIYLMLGRAAGAAGNENVEDIIQLKNEDYEECKKLLIKNSLKEKPFFIININASDMLLERRWPNEKWKFIIETLAKIWPEFSYLFVGSPAEQPFVSAVVDMLNQDAKAKTINIAGQISIGGYFACIRQAKAMITCDSGPMHIAISLATPTLSLWGPGHPDHYAIKTQHHRFIYQQIYCSPCLYHADTPPCNGDNQCMKRIDTSTVLSELSKLIGKPILDEKNTAYYSNDLNTGNETGLLGLVKIT